MNVQEKLLHYSGNGSHIGLSQMLKFFVKSLSCDGQGAVREAILYMDRTCFLSNCRGALPLKNLVQTWLSRDCGKKKKQRKLYFRFKNIKANMQVHLSFVILNI